MRFEKIKLEARAALIGNRTRQFLLLCALRILTVFFSVINAAFFLLSRLGGFYSAALQTAFAAASLAAALMLLPPLRMKIQQELNENAGVCCSRQAAFAPKNAFAASRLFALLFLIKTAWLAFFLLLPAAGGAALYLRLLSSPMGTKTAAALLCGVCVLAAAGLGFCLVTVQRYSRAPFCLAASPGITAREAIKQSVEGTRGALVETLLFKLSFFPWFLLCAAVLPIAYVRSYYKQSLTCFFCGAGEANAVIY